MRRMFIIAAVVAQVLVLAIMAGQREWVVVTGERVLVRTAPVDPNDPMRGEYARLNYEISTVPRSLCRDGVAAWFEDATASYSREFRDRRVFAVLERNELGVAEVVALTDEPPPGGLFIRGRTEWIDEHAVRVRYGIEALFMEQGRALEFEMKARDEMPGVPLNADIALSPGGLAVLRGYVWEPLGLTMRLVRRAGTGEEGGPGDRRGVVGAEVTLRNHGSEPVAIVDLAEGRSFRLVVAERRGMQEYEPVDAGLVPAPRAGDIVLLQPGQARDITLDFSAPGWLLRKVTGDGAERAPVTLEALDRSWGSWFRIEYNPPSAEACAGLPGSEHIRHARLRSRSFSPAGGMD